MIIVDGKELNLAVPVPNERSSEDAVKRWESLSYNEQWALTEFQRIREKKSITLVDPKKLDEYRLRTKPKIGFDVSGLRVNPETGVKEKWQYTDVAPLIKNNNKVYKARHFQYFHRITLTTADNVDLIFMILNIVNKNKIGLIIENKEEQAKAAISSRKLESAVENWIYNKCTDKDIRGLSYRWGLSEVDEKSLPELQVELFTFIKTNEVRKDKKRGFQAFISEMESDSDVIKIGAYVREAVKKKQIAFNPSNRSLFYAGTSEVIINSIPPVDFKNDPEEYVIQWFIRNPEEKELFLSSINPAHMEGVIEATGDYMMIENRMALRSWAKKNLGLEIGLKGSVEEGQQLIAEHIKAGVAV